MDGYEISSARAFQLDCDSSYGEGIPWKSKTNTSHVHFFDRITNNSIDGFVANFYTGIVGLTLYIRSDYICLN